MSPARRSFTGRYKTVAREKAHGATYTPQRLADFVAKQIVTAAEPRDVAVPLRVLDPALGDGALLVSLLNQLRARKRTRVEAYGFETDEEALGAATSRLTDSFPGIPLDLRLASFLEFVLDNFGRSPDQAPLFTSPPQGYDLIIANPPYVRTQVMGAARARLLGRWFGLSGRVDLYHAFILGMARVLKPGGTAGIIVPNRFMTTRSGGAVREVIRQCLRVRHIWDLGDTKLFEAAVLPSVLIVQGANGGRLGNCSFSSIYETSAPARATAIDPIDALASEGVVRVTDGRRFLVQHGSLGDGGRGNGVWRIATRAGDAWLGTVLDHTWGTFRDIGKVRVGVKTCADEVFIRSDWQVMSASERPELLRPVTTHHVGRRFRPLAPRSPHQILYPHSVLGGCRRPVDLSAYPRAKAYLERHRARLESRAYVLDAGRMWYEIWVPQDPDKWQVPKLVFRDISRDAVFWIDQDGSVVNGDCYWLSCDDPAETELLWLAAAVGNSSFVEAFYDRRFHNKLYAGRRRFITQYVEHFPLPDPASTIGKRIIAGAQEAYASVGTGRFEASHAELDKSVWRSFGLPAEEARR